MKRLTLTVWLFVLGGASACSDSPAAFQPLATTALAQGLEARVQVWAYRNDDTVPLVRSEYVAQLTGATEVPCPVEGVSGASPALCIHVDGPGPVGITLDSDRYGHIAVERPVVQTLALNLATPNRTLAMVVNSQTHQTITIRGADGSAAENLGVQYAFAGPVSVVAQANADGISTFDLQAADRGVATIAAVGHPELVPLAIPVVDDLAFAKVKIFGDDQVIRLVPRTRVAFGLETYDMAGNFVVGNVYTLGELGPGITADIRTNGLSFQTSPPVDDHAVVTYVDIRTGTIVQRFTVLRCFDAACNR